MRVNQVKKSAISWLGVAGTTQSCESCKNKLSRAEKVVRCVGQPRFGQLNALHDETGLEGHWRSGEERTVGYTHAEGGDNGVVRALGAEIEFVGDQGRSLELNTVDSDRNELGRRWKRGRSSGQTGKKRKESKERRNKMMNGVGKM